MSAGEGGKRVVVWFRNDLRLTDNYIVAGAADIVEKGLADEVLPVYCFDPRHFGTTDWNSLKTGDLRSKFLLDSVLDLKMRLRSVGSDLLVCMGQPEEVLPTLAAPGSTVLYQTEVNSEEAGVERRVAKSLKAKKVAVEPRWGSTLYHLDDLPLRKDLADLPDVFTPFKNIVEKKCTPRRTVASPKKGALPLAQVPGLDFTPTLQDLGLSPDRAAAIAKPHPNSVLEFKGGETAALARLQYYLFDSDLLATYFETRNGMLGGDYSTKLAPWLAHGTISPRTIVEEIRKYEKARVENKSTYWVIFELIWRDYFKFFGLKHGDSIFHLEGTVGGRQSWRKDFDLEKRWKEGTTGVPLVDANMRELLHTGFMSNRGRQNVASYLALELGLDWRIGADHFESLLLDYDCCSNWGNWVAAAGMTGGRVNRFNILKQSKDYDLQGDYVRAWIPELKDVPTSKIHTPWQMTPEEQEKSGCKIGETYPRPIPNQAQNGGGGGKGGYGKGGGGKGKGGYSSGGKGGGQGRLRGRSAGDFKSERKVKARLSNFDMYG
ncbi:Myosin-3 [Cymbomonas tetramitiformis]|uniref:Cryptochrome DASH n=1 Tax=Cymbomonas tetramitiformis TaxID=36881 RepID=A0AAE0L1B4_9CHLO|nr:Myosin-3 [Cymbomonas tetramitiformis]